MYHLVQHGWMFVEILPDAIQPKNMITTKVGCTLHSLICSLWSRRAGYCHLPLGFCLLLAHNSSGDVMVVAAFIERVRRCEVILTMFEQLCACRMKGNMALLTLPNIESEGITTGAGDYFIITHTTRGTTTLLFCVPANPGRSLCAA